MPAKIAVGLHSAQMLGENTICEASSSLSAWEKHRLWGFGQPGCLGKASSMKIQSVRILEGTILDMVVHQARGLHKGVGHGCAEELKSATLELSGYHVRRLIASRDILQLAGMVHARAPTYKRPNEGGE